MVEKESECLVKVVEKLIDSNVLKVFVIWVVFLLSLFFVMDLVEIVNNLECSIVMVFNMYFKLGVCMGLYWFFD